MIPQDRERMRFEAALRFSVDDGNATEHAVKNADALLAELDRTAGIHPACNRVHLKDPASDPFTTDEITSLDGAPIEEWRAVRGIIDRNSAMASGSLSMRLLDTLMRYSSRALDPVRDAAVAVCEQEINGASYVELRAAIERYIAAKSKAVQP